MLHRDGHFPSVPRLHNLADACTLEIEGLEDGHSKYEVGQCALICYRRACECVLRRECYSSMDTTAPPSLKAVGPDVAVLLCCVFVV